MELKQVHAFVAVAETGTVTAAAKRLFVAQPSVTRQVQALEHELGVTLFERKLQRLTLTHAGEAFLTHAKQLLDQAAKAGAFMEELSRGATGVLCVAAGPIPLHVVVLPAAAEFRRVWPRIHIQMREAEPESIVSLVEQGEVDLAVGSIPIISRRLRWEYLYETNLYVLLSPSHPLAASSHFTIEDLAHEEVLLVRASLSTRIANTFPLSHHHLRPKAIFASDVTQTVFRAAELEFGVAITTDSISFGGYNLKALPLLEGGRQMNLRVGAFWHEESQYSERIEGFIGFLRDAAVQRPADEYVPWKP